MRGIKTKRYALDRLKVYNEYCLLNSFHVRSLGVRYARIVSRLEASNK